MPGRGRKSSRSVTTSTRTSGKYGCTAAARLTMRSLLKASTTPSREVLYLRQVRTADGGAQVASVPALTPRRFTARGGTRRHRICTQACPRPPEPRPPPAPEQPRAQLLPHALLDGGELGGLQVDGQLGAQLVQRPLHFVPAASAPAVGASLHAALPVSCRGVASMTPHCMHGRAGVRPLFLSFN